MRISDWSSDVCSSDLHAAHRRDVFGRLRKSVQRPQPGAARQLRVQFAGLRPQDIAVLSGHDRVDGGVEAVRSEERRVGEACVSPCISRWSPDHTKTKNTTYPRSQETTE